MLEQGVQAAGNLGEKSSSASESTKEQAVESRKKKFMSKECARRKEKELLEREIILLKKEKELLERENRLLPSDKCSDMKLSTSTHQFGGNAVLYSELFPEFGGAYDSSDSWRSQVEMLINKYNISDDIAKAIIAGKLRGKALGWSRSNVSNTEMNLSTLLDEMGEMFGDFKSKITIRRFFEKRVWDFNETFIDYFHDKVQLGNKLGLSDAELIEYIIEGISDLGVRNQARITQFNSLKELMVALSSVTLAKKEKQKFGSSTSTQHVGQRQSKFVEPPPDSRCFNCGGRGHWSNECKKPRRDWGTCYKCGRQGHKAEQCTQRTRQTLAEQENTVSKH